MPEKRAANGVVLKGARAFIFALAREAALQHRARVQPHQRRDCYCSQVPLPLKTCFPLSELTALIKVYKTSGSERERIVNES